jgi:hypothetical protein
VAYLSIVGTQLAQTVEVGQAESRLNGSVLGAVAGSVAFVAMTLAVPGLRNFLGLSAPTAPGLLLAAGASALGVAVGRAVPVGHAQLADAAYC